MRRSVRRVEAARCARAAILLALSIFLHLSRHDVSFSALQKREDRSPSRKVVRKTASERVERRETTGDAEVFARAKFTSLPPSFSVPERASKTETDLSLGPSSRESPGLESEITRQDDRPLVPPPIHDLPPFPFIFRSSRKNIYALSHTRPSPLPSSSLALFAQS